MKRLFNVISIIVIVSIFSFSCEKDDNNNNNKNNHDTINTAPTAIFQISPSSGNTDTVFNFDASGSSDKETAFENLNFRWDWEGDGTWDTDYSNLYQTTHKYDNKGNYSPTLMVKDEKDLTDDTTNSLIVDDIPPPPPDCPETFVDPRNGKEYAAIEIGDQCWMAENINIGTMINGIENQTDNNEIEKYCYGDDPANCDQFGGLYQWNELMQYVSEENSQGICPEGWYIPSDMEWAKLEIELGMSYDEATSTGMRGTDEGAKLRQGGSSGFEALMGGVRNSGGDFSFMDSYATFFTSTESFQQNLAWVRYIFSDQDEVLRNKYDKTFGLSVRCLKESNDR